MGRIDFFFCGLNSLRIEFFFSLCNMYKWLYKLYTVTLTAFLYFAAYNIFFSLLSGLYYVIFSLSENLINFGLISTLPLPSVFGCCARSVMTRVFLLLPAILFYVNLKISKTPGRKRQGKYHIIFIGGT